MGQKTRPNGYNPFVPPGSVYMCMSREYQWARREGLTATIPSFLPALCTSCVFPGNRQWASREGLTATTTSFLQALGTCVHNVYFPEISVGQKRRPNGYNPFVPPGSVYILCISREYHSGIELGEGLDTTTPSFLPALCTYCVVPGNSE